MKTTELYKAHNISGSNDIPEYKKELFLQLVEDLSRNGEKISGFNVSNHENTITIYTTGENWNNYYTGRLDTFLSAENIGGLFFACGIIHRIEVTNDQ